MDRKKSFAITRYILFLIVVVSLCHPLAFSQAPTAEQTAAWEQLTPYQKSQLERTYNDWPFLEKFPRSR